MKKIFAWLLATLAALTLVLVGTTSVSQARELPGVRGLNRASAVIHDSSNNIMSQATELPDDQDYTVDYNWTISNLTIVKAGDTMTFQIPMNVQVPEDETFTMYSPENEDIGSATVLAGAHTGLVTLNKVLQINNLNRNGYIHLSVKGATPVHNEPLAPVILSETGVWEEGSDNTIINWTVQILSNGNSLNNPVLTDTLSPNQSYVPKSARMYDAKGFAIPITESVGVRSFTIKADGGFVGDLSLTYSTKTNDPTGADTFDNLIQYSDDTGNTGEAEASVERDGGAPPVVTPEQPGDDDDTGSNPEQPTNPEQPVKPENPDNGNEGTQEPNKPDENKPDENGNGETQEPNKPDENKPDENGNGETQEPNKPDENKPDENGNEETQEPNKPDENKPGEDEGTATEPNKPETNESNKPNTNESNESNKPNASNPGTQGSNQGAPVPSESEKEPSGSGLISNPVSNGKAPVTAGTQTVLPEELTNNSFSAISKTPAKLPQTGERSNSSTIWAGIAILIASVSSLAFIPRRKKN